MQTIRDTITGASGPGHAGAWSLTAAGARVEPVLNGPSAPTPLPGRAGRPDALGSLVPRVTDRFVDRKAARPDVAIRAASR